MRNFVVGCLAALFVAAPAVAQTTCKITNNPDGKPSAVRGDVLGTSLINLRTDNGPFAGKVTMNPAASDYSLLPGAAPSLTVYRVGESVTGKDWREPGSVETIDGGFVVEWPGFARRGVRVRKLVYDFSLHFLKKRERLEFPATYTQPEAFLFRIEGRLGVPSPANLASLNYTDMNAWRSDVIARYPLRVDILDEGAGIPIATIDFVWPDDATTQARIISDVNALRKAVSEGACH